MSSHVEWWSLGLRGGLGHLWGHSGIWEGELLFFFKTQHDYILIHNQNTKHHSKLMAIKYGVSFALHDKWLASLVINEFLETSNTDTDVPREMKQKNKKRRKDEITQVTRRIKHI